MIWASGSSVADLPQGLEPPHDGHHQVHGDKVGLELLVERDGLFAVGRLARDLPAGLGRHAADQLPHEQGVVNHQESFHGRRLRPAMTLPRRWMEASRTGQTS